MRAWLALALLVGCGTDSGSQQWVANFNPPPAMEGYTRFVTPTIKDIEPGANVEWCTWVADPSTVARDVIDLVGYQSATGHHAILYSTNDTRYKVGESHECTTEDMLHINFLGAVGGEGLGGNAAGLPDGLNFRLPAGQALMINSHWLNALDNPVDGQAVIDVKFDDPSPQRTIADLFANNGDTFEIPAGGAASYDVNCVAQHDLNIAMIANHMHGDGKSAYSEIIHTDGSKEMLVADAMWSAEQQFNPKYTKFSVDAPRLVHQGDTLHTHCDWQSTKSATELFPDEMCVGFLFYFPGNGMITCENGSWGM
jgi:hypothetical protein